MTAELLLRAMKDEAHSLRWSGFATDAQIDLAISYERIIKRVEREQEKHERQHADIMNQIDPLGQG